MFTPVVLVACDMNQNITYVLADNSLKSYSKNELRLKWNYNSRFIPSSLKVASMQNYFNLHKIVETQNFLFHIA